MAAKLTLVRGLPGSGKSTYARKHFQCLLVEADLYFHRGGCYRYSREEVETAHQWAQSCVDLSMRFGMDIVVTGTLVRLWELRPYLALAKEGHYDVNVMRMTQQYENVHNVPAEVIERMRLSFESFPGEVYVY